jgi:hypothetical protein
MSKCAYCKQPLVRSERKYCSNQCQANLAHAHYINRWLSGNSTGERGVSTRNFSGHVVRYLLHQSGGKCSLCGWSEINATLGRCPLEIDHIDGNHENNSATNLRVLCPNCHSLTDTYRNMNYGRGRKWRKDRYLKVE